MIVRADDIAPTPWKNGGGWARDLLLWPAAAGWVLRISLADITADGPFSAYPGVQRWFAVVEGAGVVLCFAEGDHTQRCDAAPLVFDGAAAPGCRLVDGATRDLNLMLRGVAGELIAAVPGQGWSAPWKIRGRFDRDTRTLHWGLPEGPLHTDVPGWWIGADA